LFGAEDEWNDFNEERPYAFYHKLQRGEYAFEVRMMQPDGSWGRAERLATIDRLPAWYETSVAFSLYGVLAFLILYMFGYYMLKKSRQKHEVELSQVRMHYITADHQLMNDMLAVVDRHIDDSTFDLDKLAEAMNMSKSTLHRKVKTSMGVTPLEFIHNVRLKRACDMLKKGDLTVSEIAYAVGFSTPKYFTKCFKQAFGITPSAYVNSQKDETK
jgi:AraC-like DNA-binding protein